jgi:hypothetical protein
MGSYSTRGRFIPRVWQRSDPVHGKGAAAVVAMVVQEGYCGNNEIRGYLEGCFDEDGVVGIDM